MAYLIDTTLRDGEQTPGVCFPYSAKLRIVGKLVSLGVKEVEIRTPVRDPVLFQECQGLLTSGHPVEWLVWCRARPEDLDAAYACGARRVHIAYPTSDLQLDTINARWENALTYLEPLVCAAVQRFDFVSVGAQDASRTPMERLVEYGRALQSWGVRRLRLADTLGLMMPRQVSAMVEALRTSVDKMTFEFHGHNDLGMATANAFSALAAGADAASATVLGIGERAGNAALEQLVMAMRHHYPDVSGQFNTPVIAELTRTVAECLSTNIPDNQPIVGENTRRHQSGIHIAGMLKDSRSYQPFDPALAGCGPVVLEIGALAGRHALRHTLEKAGLHPQDDALESLLLQTKNLVRQKGRPLTDAELASLCQGTR